MADREDATALAATIKSGEMSATEALEQAISRMEAVNPSLNVLTDRLYERARETAAQPLGEGPFAGVPYLLKDMYDLVGTVTGFGSRLADISPPATQTFESTQALQQIGLNIFGKTTLGEFGFLPTTESLKYGVTRNPWNIAYSSGGSSGGSGAAVAAGALPFADAADGGGSVRIPASVCGLVGLKPSRDRMKGQFPTSTGVKLVEQHCVSRTVRDTANYFAAMERTDGTSPYPTVGAVTSPLDRPIKIGFHLNGLRSAPNADVTHTVMTALKTLEGLGHSVEETDWPFSPGEFLAAFGAVWAQSAMNAVRAVKTATDAFGIPIDTVLEPYTLTVAGLAEEADEAQFAVAAAALAGFSDQWHSWFDTYDVIVSPVLITPSVKTGTIDGTTPFAEINERMAGFADYTMVENATGGAAISLPLGQSSDGLPIGVQFAAPAGGERLLLEIAFLLEQAMPWHDRKPSIWVGC